MAAADHETSLPTLLALDIAFAALSEDVAHDEPMLLAGATPGTVREVLARGAGRIAFLGDDASPPLGRDEGGQFSQSLWIAPDPADWRATASSLDRHLLPGGRLAVIGSGPLAGPLGRARPDALGIPGSAIDPQRVRRLLAYQTRGEWRLYGLRSVRWAMLRMAASRAGRPDLADRWQAAFQLSLLELGRPRLWGITVSLIGKPTER